MNPQEDFTVKTLHLLRIDLVDNEEQHQNGDDGRQRKAVVDTSQLFRKKHGHNATAIEGWHRQQIEGCQHEIQKHRMEGIGIGAIKAEPDVRQHPSSVYHGRHHENRKDATKDVANGAGQSNESHPCRRHVTPHHHGLCASQHHAKEEKHGRGKDDSENEADMAQRPGGHALANVVAAIPKPPGCPGVTGFMNTGRHHEHEEDPGQNLQFQTKLTQNDPLFTDRFSTQKAS